MPRLIYGRKNLIAAQIIISVIPLLAIVFIVFPYSYGSAITAIIERISKAITPTIILMIFCFILFTSP